MTANDTPRETYEDTDPTQRNIDGPNTDAETEGAPQGESRSKTVEISLLTATDIKEHENSGAQKITAHSVPTSEGGDVDTTTSNWGPEKSEPARQPTDASPENPSIDHVLVVEDRDAQELDSESAASGSDDGKDVDERASQHGRGDQDAASGSDKESDKSSEVGESQPDKKDSDKKPKTNSDDPKEQLQAAIEEGDVERVRKLKEDGVDVDTKFDDDRDKDQTALILAAKHSRLEVVNEILTWKPDVNAKNEEDETALFVAAQAGDTEIVEVLLDADADINAETKYNDNPLLISTFKGHELVVKLLLDRGADIKARNGGGLTAVHLAIREGHKSIVELLLKSPDLDIQARTSDERGWTFLHQAAQNGDKSVVELILDHGVDIEARTNDDEVTAVYIAAGWGFAEVVKLFIERGAKLNIKSTRGWTPLFSATDCGHVEALKVLLAEMDREGIISESNNGNTPLNAAANVDDEEMVLLIIDTKAYLPEGPEFGVDLTANPREIEEVGKLLLDKMEKPESRTRKKLQTVLHWAVLNGEEELVQRCIDNAQDLKSWTQSGMTLLYTAASKGHQKLVTHLLDIAEVDILTMTQQIITALHLAAGNGHDAMVKFFLGKLPEPIRERQPDPNALLGKPERNETLLYVAAKNGYDVMVSALLSKLQEQDRWVNTVVKETTVDKETALSQAVKKKHRKVEELLWAEMKRVDFEANFHAADKALVWAARLEKPGQERILRSLFEKRPLLAQLEEPLREQILRSLRDKSMRSSAINGRADSPRNVIGESPETWTALHWAVYHGHVMVVWWLLVRGGHLRAKDIKSARKIAKDMKSKMVEWGIGSEATNLEGRFTVEVSSKQDAVGILTPRENEEMPVAKGKKGNYSLIIGLLHSPPPVQGESAHFDNDDKPTLREPPPKQRQVCSEFDVTIADFYRMYDRTDDSTDGRVDFLYQSSSVYDVIYGSGPERIMSEAKKWNVHDLGIVEPLASNTGESRPRRGSAVAPKTADRAPAVGPAQVSSQENREGSKISAPTTSGTSKTSITKRLQDTVPEERQKNVSEFRFRWLHVPANNMEWIEDLMTRIIRDSNRTNRELRQLNDFVRRSWIELSGAGKQRRYMKPQCTKERIRAKIQQIEQDFKAEPKAGKPTRWEGPKESTIPEDTEDEEPEIKQGIDERTKQQPVAVQNIDNEGRIDMIEVTNDPYRFAIYMPYLTFAVLEDDKAKAGSAISSHEKLMEGYAGKIVHGSRTLDQYYYSSLENTKARDKDQVVTRYLERKMNSKPRMLRVDQLWLWVIDEKTIISSSTHRLDEEEDLVLESIFNDLIEGNSKGRSPPSSVEDMIQLIMSVTVGFPDQHRIEVGKDGSLESTLQMFENSITTVSDTEAVLFEEFEKRVNDDIAKQNETSEKLDTDESSENPYYSIHEEIERLKEIKDIRDELNILKSLCEDQEKVWDKAFENLPENSGVKGNYLQAIPPSDTINEIMEMDSDADRVQNAFNTLLDLKQKQANISEAISGRKQAEHARRQTDIALRQAEETGKQGNTLMVFTMVTIVFLPMSFLASLFALNITSFPHSSGNLTYSPGWIFPILFGVSAAISIVLIIAALKVNPMVEYWSNLRKSLKGDRGASTSSSSSPKKRARGHDPSTVMKSQASEDPDHNHVRRRAPYQWWKDKFKHGTDASHANGSVLPTARSIDPDVEPGYGR